MKTHAYMDLTTDYAFKRVFASENNKDLLISLINAVLGGRRDVVDLSYERNEHVGEVTAIGTIILDLCCTADDGTKFIIEVQRSPQLNFKRRMLYYGSKLIVDQAPTGDRKSWNYDVSAVYVIALMEGFVFTDDPDSKDVRSAIYLCNSDTGSVFYEDLCFIYIQLFNFTKADDALKSDLDTWLYLLKNMPRMTGYPPQLLEQPLFEKLFNVAQYSKLDKEERMMYDVSLKRKWDQEAVRQLQERQLETAIKQSLDEGIKKGLETGVKRGIKEGVEKGMKAGVEKGMKAGVEKGIEEGKALGIEEGIAHRNASIVRKLISHGDWSDEYIADLAEVSINYVRRVRKEIADEEGRS